MSTNMINNNKKTTNLQQCRVLYLFVFIFQILRVSFLSATTSVVVVDGVVAKVDDYPITIGEVMRYVEPVRRQLIKTYRGDELNLRLKNAFEEARDNIIDKRLILNAYEKQKFKVPEWLVERRIGEIIHEDFNGDRTALIKALSQENITYENWRKEIKDQIIVAVMRQNFVGNAVAVSPSTVKNYYEANKDSYVEPEQVRLSILEIKKGTSQESITTGRQRIKDLRNKIIRGEDFAGIAKINSEGADSQRGGDSGWVTVTSIRTEIQDAVKNMQIGDVSGVIETSDAFFIIKLEGRKEQEIKQLSEVYSQIEHELWSKEAEKLYQNWIKSLRSVAKIEIFDVDLQ